MSQSRSYTSWRRWGLVAACVAAVLVASVLRPPAVLGADAGGVAVDKWLHGIGYALLAAVVAAVAALGLAVEAVQAPLAYRSSSVADAAANAAGALVGVAAAWLLARVR